MSNLTEKIERNGEFSILEDGFVYYFPNGGGGLSPHNLREIADELDRRNVEWEKLANADN